MIGIVTGMRAEARCLPPGAGQRILCSGADSERARRAALDLVSDGAEALLSFGLAGGLSPAVRAGDLLLPEVVVPPGAPAVAVEGAWRARVEARLYRAGSVVRSGRLAGSDRPLVTAAAKRQLHEATSALAVDMESHAVAEVARHAGLPFLVLRAVTDPFDQALPRAATVALGPDGGIRLLAVAEALLDRPLDLLPLLRLARQRARALGALRRAALLTGPTLGLE